MVIGGEVAEISRREVFDAVVDQDEIQHVNLIRELIVFLIYLKFVLNLNKGRT